MTSKRHSAAHFSVSPIKSTGGRSAVAAAAYRSGTKLRDDRTGQTHDYRRKGGVLASGIVGIDADRSDLWNTAEATERRSNGRTGYSGEVALPNELDRDAQERLMNRFCEAIHERHGVAVDWSIHAPHRSAKEGRENTHAHFAYTDRPVEADGTLGKKIRAFADKKDGPAEIEWMRSIWTGFVNDELDAQGHEGARVDLRSHERRAAAGDGPPGLVSQPHLGPARWRILTRHERDRQRAAKAGEQIGPLHPALASFLANAKANAARLANWAELKRIELQERLGRPSVSPVAEDEKRKRIRERAAKIHAAQQSAAKSAPQNRGGESR